MRILLLTLSILLFLSPLEARKIRDVRVTPKTPEAVNYGTEIALEFSFVVKRGKTKTFQFDDIKKYFTFLAKDGELVMNRISNNAYSICFRILKYPSSFQLPDPTLDILFDNNEGMTKKFHFHFPFDQRCPLTLDFRGRNGTNGETGKDRGAPLILRNGKTGADGTDGANGEAGAFLRIMTAVGKDTSGNDVLYLLVNDSSHHTRYYYRTSHADLGILANVSGGNGGNGGNGSAGKDAEVTSKGTKNAGSGGDGGNGGDGGHVIVMEHPTAKGYSSLFQVVSYGGIGGMGGAGGSGGAGGKGLDQNSAAGSNGSNGSGGNNGEKGMPGTGIEVYLLEK